MTSGRCPGPPPEGGVPPPIGEGRTRQLTFAAPCAVVSSPDYEEGTGYPAEAAKREYFFHSAEAEVFLIGYVEEFHVCQENKLS